MIRAAVYVIVFMMPFMALFSSHPLVNQVKANCEKSAACDLLGELEKQQMVLKKEKMG